MGSAHACTGRCGYQGLDEVVGDKKWVGRNGGQGKILECRLWVRGQVYVVACA